MEIINLVREAIEEAKLYRPIENPAILVGEEIYRMLYKEVREQSIGDDKATFAYQPISEFGGLKIYVVDRDRYLNIVEEGDIIGKQ